MLAVSSPPKMHSARATAAYVISTPENPTRRKMPVGREGSSRLALEVPTRRQIMSRV